MKTFNTLLKTEIKLSIRDMNMVIFALVMPVVVLILLGIIYGDQVAFEGATFTFLAQSFGAVAAISICASGVMGLPLVISETRSKKILKRYKVTPITPVTILMVHITVYLIYNITSLILLYLTASLFFGFQLEGSWLLFLGTYFLVTLSIFSIGMVIGGVSPNAQTANLLCVIAYFPMLIFSGATIPSDVMPEALQRVAAIMPLTQGIKLLQATSLGLPLYSVYAAIAVIIGLSVLCIGISIRFFKWE